MKIVCEKCNSRYSLSDDKVRNIGRTRFGVRCKTCGNLIRVTVIEAPIEPTPEELRGFTPAPPPPKEKSGVDIFADADLDGEFGKAFGGQSASRAASAVEPAARGGAASAGPPSASFGAAGATKKKREDTKLYDYREFQSLLKEKGLLGAATKPKTPQEPEVEWYLALDGQQTGPYVRKAAEAKVAADGDLAENGFAWKDGLADWLPIVDIPELKEAARKAIASRVAPPPPISVAPGARPVAQAAQPASHPAAAAKPPEPAAPPAVATTKSGGLFAAAAPQAEPEAPKARNEQSVLFSLDALKASTFAAKEEPPVPATPPKPSNGQSIAIADTTSTASAPSVNPEPAPPAAVKPVPAAAKPVIARPIATPIQVGRPSPFAAAHPKTSAPRAKRSNGLWIGLGIAVVAGGGAAIAYFAVQQNPAKPQQLAQTSADSDSRRARDDTTARPAGDERKPDETRVMAPTAAAISGRAEIQTDGRADAREAARLPLPEGTGATPAPAVTGSSASPAQPAAAARVDARATETQRPAVATARQDDDEPRDRRRRRGKRRHARQTAAASSRAATSAARDTASRATESSTELSETPARIAVPPASAARGDAVLDDILGGGGSSSPPARTTFARPARRADARRAEVRAAPAPRREETAPEPQPRQDPPREPARAAADSSLPRTLDGADIKSKVERNRHRVNLCYSSTVADKSEKKGRLVVSFTIERNGRPSRVGVDRAGYWGPEMASCVTTAFSKLRFGQFSGDPIEVRFPFVLGDF
ncbi:MAG: zinc-ribbon domain-containing protein [Deltaproteobacteria bacterium]|nr:zinc-ribbon domain-containing protein [Deltaproteobacteria bacterium]